MSRVCPRSKWTISRTGPRLRPYAEFSRSMAGWETCTSHVIGTPRRAAVSPLCGSTISATLKTRWTPWMGPCSTGGNCEYRWRAMAGHQTLTSGAEAAVDPQGGMEATVAGAEVVRPAPAGADAVVPEAGAAAVAVTTAAPGLVPPLDPVPSPAHPARASPRPDRGPAAAPRLPTEGQGRGPRACPNPPRTTESSLSNNSSNPDPVRRCQTIETSSLWMSTRA
ncbi:hypothetical protein J4Q44_G00004320 [Coregonus suidteri]|uniref:Uncharacterized protein n=1 Tax=Coregonus suidteri TaxID=861788 RepID=A0AAN8MEQ7_9TELE